jgi:CRP-like cAMP-binding protein
MTNSIASSHELGLARGLIGRALGFRDCPASTLDSLVSAGRVIHLGKGEALALRGAPSQFVYVVVSGTLESSLTRSDGHRHLVSYLQPGDTTGIVGLLDGLGHINDLRAKGRCSVLLIPKAALQELRAADPSLVIAFEMQMAFRSRLLYERLASDQSLPLETRVARLLHTLAGLYGLTRGDEILLNLKVSQADLADWLGTSRQRINEVMQKMQVDGLIRVRYASISLVKPDKVLDAAKRGQ